MSFYTADLDSYSQYSFAPCSPCSSGSTCVQDGQFPEPATSHFMKIFLPNLIDRVSVAVEDVERFVHTRLGRPVEITIAHLLIYLFSVNSAPSVTHINELKLIHKGKPYTIQRACDLLDKTPKIKDVIERFPTFQLIISPQPLRSPLKMPVETMLVKSSTAVENGHSISVTYAEAMVRLFKKPTRKLSVDLLDSQATDLDDNGSARPKGNKIRNSFRRIFSKPRNLGPQATVAETLLISL